jgi:hypothetical protein
MLAAMADLVDPSDKAPRVAAFDGPLTEPNLEDARIVHTLAPLADLPVLGRVESAYRQRFRLKSWQYMTAVSDELFVAFVIGTAGFASNGFVYAAELKSGRLYKRFAITPLSMGTTLQPTSTAGTHAFHTRGLDISVASRDAGRAFSARVDGLSAEDERIEARLDFDARGNDHLATCVPLPGGRWSYTHKQMAFGVSGTVTLDGKVFPFVRDRAFGTMDFTKQYALRHAVWKWVALCGRSKQGAVVGLNLVDPTPDAPISENAAWIDGRLEPLVDVRLAVDPPGNIDSPWSVEAASVDLRSRPVAHVEQKLDLPLIKHRLRHVVSAFSGRIRTKGGQVHDLESIVGIAEDNDTWW